MDLTSSWRTALLTGALALLGAAPASAATRYASPGGGKEEPCALSSPCEINWAVEKAKEGDEVIALADKGPYSVTSAIQVKTSVTLSGPATGALPELDDASAGFSILFVTGGLARRLHVMSAKAFTTLAAVFQGTVEDLSLEARGKEVNLADVSSNGLLRDSVLFAAPSLEKVHGVRSQSNFGAGYVRNVTVEVPGAGSVALQSSGVCFPKFEFPFGCEPGFSYATDVNVANSILRGGGFDIEAYDAGSGYVGTVEIGHSNYRPANVQATTASEVKDLGGNQSSEPLLSSDFRELAGSPTIDAGVTDEKTGTADIDGTPRLQGPAPDIGAFEFPVPTPAPALLPPGPGAGGSGATPGHGTAGKARAKGLTVVVPLACSGLLGQSCRFAISLTSVVRISPERVTGIGARKRSRNVRVGSRTLTLVAGSHIGAVVHLNKAGRRLLARFHRLPLTARTAVSDASNVSHVIAAKRLTLRLPAHHRR